MEGLEKSPHSSTDRVVVFGTIDGGSIPSEDTADFLGSVAQLVEHLPLKEVVVSSNLTGLTLCHGLLPFY